MVISHEACFGHEAWSRRVGMRGTKFWILVTEEFSLGHVDGQELEARDWEWFGHSAEVLRCCLMVAL